MTFSKANLSTHMLAGQQEKHCTRTYDINKVNNEAAESLVAFK